MNNDTRQATARWSGLRHHMSSVHLDWGRGIAAIAVLIYHVRYRFFLDYSDLPTPRSLLAQAAYLVTAFGHDAVIVFFVLSGFFISRSIMTDVAKDQWSWGRYGQQRLVRLYLVLIPGLILTVLWDDIGMRNFSSSPIYTGDAPLWKNDYFNVANRSTSKVLAENTVFLQALYVPPFGSNAALWSLSYEFWYYVLFPCLYLSIVKQGWRRILLLLASVVVASFVGKGVILYFPIWLMGTLLCLLPQTALLGKKCWFTGASLTTGAIFIALMLVGHFDVALERIGGALAADYLTGAGFALFIYVLLHDARPVRPGFYEKAGRRLAGFSYTLYVTHLPLLVLLRAWLVPGRPWEPRASTVLFAVVLSIVCIVYAATIARITEDRTNEVREWITSVFARVARAKSHPGIIK